MTTQNLVEIANQATNMDFIGLPTNYDCDDFNTIVEYYPVTTVPDALQGWAFKLIQSNTQKFYENSSIGWNASDKLKELSEAGARYLIARQVHTINNNIIIGNPIGFVMFQFTFEETMADDDSKIETIYCYEIQLTEEARNKGLGTFLMNTMEGIGKYWGMKKSMLTAFKENTAALNFYCNHLGYEIDEISPSRCVDPEYIDDYDYEILSKRL